MELDRGWSFECFVQKLNELVFFWPGTEDGPMNHGRRHFERYKREREDVVMIRVKTKSLFDANKDAAPRFSRYNSGSPRYAPARPGAGGAAKGKPSLRGEQTFRTADVFPHAPSRVVETVYPGSVILPEDSEFGSAPGGPWKPLFP